MHESKTPANFYTETEEQKPQANPASAYPNTSLKEIKTQECAMIT